MAKAQVRLGKRDSRSDFIGDKENTARKELAFLPGELSPKFPHLLDDTTRTNRALLEPKNDLQWLIRGIDADRFEHSPWLITRPVELPCFPVRNVTRKQGKPSNRVQAHGG